jgi:hypothetical protein
MKSKSELVKKAAKLYQDFTGHYREFMVERAKLPSSLRNLKALTVIGECEYIAYNTVRDGEPEKYIHHFRKSSRPLFCVTPDGKQIVLFGGAYEFTDRGIVDK